MTGAQSNLETGAPVTFLLHMTKVSFPALQAQGIIIPAPEQTCYVHSGQDCYLNFLSTKVPLHVRSALLHVLLIFPEMSAF